MKDSKIRKVWKIHSIETVESALSDDWDTCNTRFYKSKAAAVSACARYCGEPGQSSEGFVIFRAAVVVRPKSRPVDIVDFEEG